ncbi:hypothetical protein FB45DRAFT_849131 [Roridomyces roridus]|uniref:C3H1-type domain-containing protein n=1 Tax=Roridomyces roridus TaxID=1738132 RepID=A0AAD7F8K4_9AGAR|nr:hypothetical protein FB45DRAFT_849131 [Roridomyces roridus]
MEGSLSTANVPLAVQHPIELCLDTLKDEFVNVLQNEITYKNEIEQLKTELNVYKRAAKDLETELETTKRMQKEAEEQNGKLQAECLTLKNQDKGHRVIVLLDGDGTIFSPQFIEKGQKGGHAAAQQLSDSTIQCLAANYEPRPLQLWVYVFFNKRGLVEALRRAGFAIAIAKFEEFVMGFNQASERFLMVDVGTTKEAADAKLKVYLEDEIRLPETFKIVFGGCHDNGYLANLRSQITAGYKEKLILLQSYTEIAGEIAALGLPILNIPDLFLSQKLGEHPVFNPATGLNPNSTPKAAPTKALPPVSSPLSGNVNLGTPQTAPVVVPRLLDPKKPIAHQKPGLCTLYYLRNQCKYRKSCKFAHDYVITDAQRDELVKFAKKAPCQTVLSGEICALGDSCPFGHVCPFMPKCFFLKKGTCKFNQASMHASPTG